MDKKPNRKSYRVHGTKQCRIGVPLGIHDKNGQELCTGDKVHWNCKPFPYDGILLWNTINKCYMFCISYSKWYGDNEYDANSYGKGFELRMDDGARMDMELIKED